MYVILSASEGSPGQCTRLTGSFADTQDDSFSLFFLFLLFKLHKQTLDSCRNLYKVFFEKLL